MWSVLARVWSDWKDALVFVKPETVIRWQRKRFKAHWTKLSKSGEPGRPKIPEEVRELIRTMSRMNPTWGSPHIVGELAKLGISVWPSTVKKYMVKADKPPSQTWRTFLKNHAHEIVSIDFLVVPTVRFKMLYVLVFLSIERRRVIHFNVTAHPTAEWTALLVAPSNHPNTARSFQFHKSVAYTTATNVGLPNPHQGSTKGFVPDIHDLFYYRPFAHLSCTNQIRCR